MEGWGGQERCIVVRLGLVWSQASSLLMAAAKLFENARERLIEVVTNSLMER